MLAHARILGHTFDPLTVFWCLTPSGEVRAVVFEVHNTYGERHAYLLDLDERGSTTVDKRFYVSPFNDVSGSYAISLAHEPHGRRGDHRPESRRSARADRDRHGHADAGDRRRPY